MLDLFLCFHYIMKSPVRLQGGVAASVFVVLASESIFRFSDCMLKGRPPSPPARLCQMPNYKKELVDL